MGTNCSQNEGVDETGTNCSQNEEADKTRPNPSRILPTNEGQVRPLAQLEPQQQVEVWQRAVQKAGGKVPSARIVTDVVQRIMERTNMESPFGINPLVVDLDTKGGGPSLQAIADCRVGEPTSTSERISEAVERELKAMEASHLAANRQFAQQVFPILHSARLAHRAFHTGELTLEQLGQHRIRVEAQLVDVLNHPPAKGWAADAQNLANRFRKHWSDWFTFLSHPEVKPDNNDAERAVRVAEG